MHEILCVLQITITSSPNAHQKKEKQKQENEIVPCIQIRASQFIFVGQVSINDDSIHYSRQRIHLIHQDLQSIFVDSGLCIVWNHIFCLRARAPACSFWFLFSFKLWCYCCYSCCCSSLSLLRTLFARKFMIARTSYYSLALI